MSVLLANGNTRKLIDNYALSAQAIANIKQVTDEALVSSNVYKTIASLESCGVVSVESLPVGSPEVKLNHALAQAINTSAARCVINMDNALEVIKSWSNVSIQPHQSERLQSAINTYNQSAKATPIPPYSQLTDDTRVKVQRIFQSTFKSSVPVSIDIIIELIDRYNAGAPYAILFKALGVDLKLSNIFSGSHAVDDELVNETTVDHLQSRLNSYIRLVKDIKECKTLTALSLSHLIAQSGFTVNGRLSQVIGEIEPRGQYISDVKECRTFNYSSLIPHVTSVMTHTPLDESMVTRLGLLTKAADNVATLKVTPIDIESTHLSDKDMYKALNGYYLLTDEISATLIATMHVLEVSVRSNQLIEQLITAIKMVTGLIDTLYAQLSEAIMVDGEMSQESLTIAVNRMGSISKSNLLSVPDNLVVNSHANYMTLRSEYLKLNDELLRLKLRDTSSLNESSAQSFKSKHTATILNMFLVDISAMSARELFEFMTHSALSLPLTHSAHVVLNSALDAQSLKLKKALSRHIQGGALEGQLPAVLMTAVLRGINERRTLVMDIEGETDKALAIEELVARLEARLNLNTPTYLPQPARLSTLDVNQLHDTPQTQVNSPATKVMYQLGGGFIDFNSQQILLAAFEPSTSGVALKDITCNREYSDYSEQFFNHRDVFKAWDDVASIAETQLEGACKAVVASDETLINVLSALDDEPSQESYAQLITLLSRDAMDVLNTAVFTATLVKIYEQYLIATLRATQDVYVTFNKISHDFLTIAK